jgi:hypothetical protein
MTPQQIDAMKLALEALEGFYEYGYDRQECFEHITAIKEALAEHAMREVQRLGQEIEQEPVAWIYDPITERIITPQRTWVGLTDREIDELWMSHHDDFGNPLSATGYERAIEAKLKEKNT